MHDATTTNPCTTHSHGAEGQGLRMVERQEVCGTLPAGTSGRTSLAYVSDVVSILKRKRDRYKGRGKMIQARTVQACIDELLGVWK